MKSVLLYHQCGFREVWNFDSFARDGVGEGLIISPINMEAHKVNRLPKSIKQCSFFDPQFYLPKSSHKALNSYEFFPNNIADGYKTANYDEYASQSARICVDYQVQNDFKYVIIPTVFFDELPNNYIAQLKELYILPFLNAISTIGVKKPTLLSIIIKDIQLNDSDYRDDLLNLLTSYSEIDGIYLIPYYKTTSKRIKDVDFLLNLMTFIDVLRANDLEVHVGYTDIEAYILTIADVTSITVGSYENLRNFATSISSHRFVTKEENKGMNSPTPRIYSSKLLQWVDHRYLSSLQSDYTKSNELFDDTEYKVTMFEPGYNWHFMKPELYKHYFLSFSRQIKSLPNSFDERYNYIMHSIKNAMHYFGDIRDCGILLDSNSDDSHLGFWGTAVNRFVKYKRGV
jgi:hypothetical protein